MEVAARMPPLNQPRRSLAAAHGRRMWLRAARGTAGSPLRCRASSGSNSKPSCPVQSRMPCGPSPARADFGAPAALSSRAKRLPAVPASALLAPTAPTKPPRSHFPAALAPIAHLGLQCRYPALEVHTQTAPALQKRPSALSALQGRAACQAASRHHRAILGPSPQHVAQLVRCAKVAATSLNPMLLPACRASRVHIVLLVQARLCHATPVRSIASRVWPARLRAIRALLGTAATSAPLCRRPAALGRVKTNFNPSDPIHYASATSPASNPCHRPWHPSKAWSGASPAALASIRMAIMGRRARPARRGTGARGTRRSRAPRTRTTRIQGRRTKQTAHAAPSAQRRWRSALARASRSAPALRASTLRRRITRRTATSSVPRAAARALSGRRVRPARSRWQCCHSSAATSGSPATPSTCVAAPMLPPTARRGTAVPRARRAAVAATIRHACPDWTGRSAATARRTSTFTCARQPTRPRTARRVARCPPPGHSPSSPSSSRA